LDISEKSPEEFYNLLLNGFGNLKQRIYKDRPSLCKSPRRLGSKAICSTNRHCDCGHTCIHAQAQVTVHSSVFCIYP
jgi:hypothetical protein